MPRGATATSPWCSATSTRASITRASAHCCAPASATSLSQGRGPTPTFPRWTPWPRIELDHILATPGVAFRNVESFEIAGTDHLALVATLTV